MASNVVDGTARRVREGEAPAEPHQPLEAARQEPRPPELRFSFAQLFSAMRITPGQRVEVEGVCWDHAAIRDWVLHAVRARTNHVHLVVTVDRAPNIVRDQFKANTTRVLRAAPEPVTHKSVWTRGGDCEVIEGEENLLRVLQYVLEAQDRMDRTP